MAKIKMPANHISKSFLFKLAPFDRYKSLLKPIIIINPNYQIKHEEENEEENEEGHRPRRPIWN